MTFATSGHNQIIDVLARSGLVGTPGLALYAVILLAFSVRYARASHCLSIAIFIAICLRWVSEVPLTMFGYGPEALQGVLLLGILGGHGRGDAARTEESAAYPRWWLFSPNAR